MMHNLLFSWAQQTLLTNRLYDIFGPQPLVTVLSRDRAGLKRCEKEKDHKNDELLLLILEGIFVILEGLFVMIFNGKSK